MDRFNNNMPENEAEILRKEIFNLLRKSLRPEFLNRIDEIVMFTPLSVAQIRDIVKMQLNGVRKLLENNNMHLDVSDEAIDWLANHGYDPQLGARPVKRLIQREIINELSKRIIAGSIRKDEDVYIDVKNGSLTFGSTK